MQTGRMHRRDYGEDVIENLRGQWHIQDELCGRLRQIWCTLPNVSRIRSRDDESVRTKKKKGQEEKGGEGKDNCLGRFDRDGYAGTSKGREAASTSVSWQRTRPFVQYVLSLWWKSLHDQLIDAWNRKGGYVFSIIGIMEMQSKIWKVWQAFQIRRSKMRKTKSWWWMRDEMRRQE